MLAGIRPNVIRRARLNSFVQMAGRLFTLPLACDLRILLCRAAVRSAPVVAFAIDHRAGLGPVFRSAGAARAGPGGFRRPGRSAQRRAEAAESQPDPVGLSICPGAGLLCQGRRRSSTYAEVSRGWVYAARTSAAHRPVASALARRAASRPR